MRGDCPPLSRMPSRRLSCARELLYVSRSVPGRDVILASFEKPPPPQCIKELQGARDPRSAAVSKYQHGLCTGELE